MKKSQIKRIGLTFSLIVLSLVIGIYIGFKNNFLTSQLAAVAGSDVPDELAGGDSFEQFYEVWKVLNEKHPGSEEKTTDDKMWGAIGGLVSSLDDPYTVFFPPKENEQFNIDLKGEFYGVGMEVGMREYGLTVVAPLKNSPAEQAGVKSGDVIIKIDSSLTSDLDVDEAVDLIRGEKGTEVTLTVLREGDESTREIKIIRDLVKIPLIETEHRKEDGVFIINLFSFNDGSIEAMEDALTEFVESKSKNLILDLRNNPGGYLSAAIDISSWFLEEGKVVVEEEGKLEKYNKTYRSGRHFLAGDYNMVVLVDGGSASASEIVAGALQEHGKAKLVGTKTFGKGSVQELVPMQNGTSLKVTVAKWLTPGGVSISENGLTPDIEVEFDSEEYAETGKDNQLEKAIEVIKEKN